MGRPRLLENRPHIKQTPPSAANYNSGCRCDDCRAKRSEASADVRRRNREAYEYAIGLGAKQ